MIKNFIIKLKIDKIRAGCALILVLCVIVFCLSAFCQQIKIGEDGGVKVSASGIHLTLNLIRHISPAFRAGRFVPFVPVVYMTAIVVTVIEFVSLVNVIFMAVIVILGKRCKIVWTYFFALPALVIVAIGVLCSLSDTPVAVDLRLLYVFKVRLVYVLQPFIMLLTFILSYILSPRFAFRKNMNDELPTADKR